MSVGYKNDKSQVSLYHVFAVTSVAAALWGLVAHAAPLPQTDESIEIVGGSKVSASDPIASTTVGLSDGEALCTASLIDDDIAVTAAHCVDGANLDSLE